ncbi:retron system putative HNH endonuclease [Bacillus mycoides]|uniref:Septu protein PtuB n=1 Tax=Bacillus mycoides (strain KBAB4) TaxID=315730 RepID=PTUB_BACMK|nr:retron system putative HNH endonuclease [Bacillus mycoides]A9VQW6.1 RecName: Full=Septu protein PtuB; AltName: Full=Putative nuclease PtuB [Bacillus mycoides KBAB4]ABY44615.1 conserved hypothetical protein [Bacillus mycoides KBAB4]
MIKVQREAEPAVLNLTDSDSIGFKELEAAKKTTFTKDTKFPFEAYKDESVKNLLKKMFNGKCGYCESIINVTSYEEIEHFRPKKAINIEGIQGLTYPGYYWLAMSWNNLLISCQRCNRSHKKNYFPIENESNRAKAPGEESGEEVLLLNPCEDDPSEHLEFKDTGIIEFKEGSKKGEKSIKVYALHRRELTEERAKVAKDIELKKVQILDGLSTLKVLLRYQEDSDLQKEIEKTVSNIISLYDFIFEYENDPNRPYQAMVTQITSDFLSERKELINKLKTTSNRKNSCEQSHISS